MAPAPTLPREARLEIVERLRSRRAEMEQATLARAHALAKDRRALDVEYANGLRTAVSDALGYGLASVERSGSPPPIPVTLFTQARLAAREGVSLETVLRRYIAGNALFGDFLIEEAQKSGMIQPEALKQLHRAQSSALDRLLGAIGEEYGRERRSRHDGSTQRLKERIDAILAGELVDTSDLGYELGQSHLAVIASGSHAKEAVHELRAELDRQSLCVDRREGVIWAWFGSASRFEPTELERLARRSRPASVAIGEPSSGVAGWRLSHRQARAALPIAVQCEGSLVRYREVALLAATLQDDLLATSLHQLYLAPLAGERDGGLSLRETLRAYFAAERNASSAAAALGVTRQTVTSRLMTIERRLDRPLRVCAAELEILLGLEEVCYELPLNWPAY